MSDDPEFRDDAPEDPSEDPAFRNDEPSYRPDQFTYYQNRARAARPDMAVSDYVTPTLQAVETMLRALGTPEALSVTHAEQMHHALTHLADQVNWAIEMLRRWEEHEEIS